MKKYSYLLPLAPGGDSPAGRIMDEAIQLGIEEKSPYPERAIFLDVGASSGESVMRQAARDDYAVVLVSPDLSTRVLGPEEILGRAGVDVA